MQFYNSTNSSISINLATIALSQIAPELVEHARYNQLRLTDSLPIPSKLDDEERRRRSDAPVPPSPCLVQEFEIKTLPTLMEDFSFEDIGDSSSKKCNKSSNSSKSYSKKMTAYSVKNVELEKLKSPKKGQPKGHGRSRSRGKNEAELPSLEQ